MNLFRTVLASALLLAPVAAGQPNFLVILVDDMGWRDVGFAGNEFIDSPHIDALARDGTVFTQACASAPNCAPARACLVSGQYPQRHGVFTVVDERHKPGSAHHRVLAAESRPELATESATIAEVLKDGGYATALIGMWNLGRGRRGPCTPTGQGFDVDRQPKEIGFEKDAYHDESGRYLTDALAAEGISFIERNRDKPWFLYLAPHAVHAPFDPPAELLEKYVKKAGSNRELDPARAATVEALDMPHLQKRNLSPHWERFQDLFHLRDGSRVPLCFALVSASSPATVLRAFRNRKGGRVVDRGGLENR